MGSFGSERFWLTTLVFATILLVALWVILVSYRKRGLALYLRKRKPRLYWALVIVSSAATVFWFYLLYQITGESPLD